MSFGEECNQDLLNSSRESESRVMPQAESTKPVATLAPAAPQSDNVRVKNDHQIPGMFVVADYNQFLTFLVQADDKRDTPVIDGSI